MNEGRWVTLKDGRRIKIDTNKYMNSMIKEEKNKKEEQKTKKIIRKKEKELKEAQQEMEYLYHNITRNGRKTSTFMKRTNLLADRINELEREIDKLKGTNLYK